MSIKPNNSSTHPIVQLVKNWFSRFFQNHEVYPIKYYKKGKRFRRNVPIF